ncbi:hypothetical protein BHE74_00031856 [Ensete ventricosum]|nr:hypothetical protein BHE74_00031856 [Ensete ventricosum]
MTSSSKGTCIMSREWFTGRAVVAFEFSNVTSRKRERRSPLLVSSGGNSILTRWRVNRALGLTSTDTPGEVALYGESIGTEVWHEGVAHDAALMVRGGGLTDAPSSWLHLGCSCGHGAGMGPTPARTLTWPWS